MKLFQKSKGGKHRVVVTGLGVVSSIGIGAAEFWKNLIAGKSGISDIESFDTSDYPVHKGGEVKSFHPEDFIDKRKIRHLGRASQMAIAAAKIAAEDALFKKNNIIQSGVFVGTTMGEIQELEEMNSEWLKTGHLSIDKSSIFLFPTNVIAVNTALELKCQKYNFMMPTACASGNYSIGFAFDLVKKGELNVALAGGSDSFSRIAFTGFNRLMAMAPEKCQPFDKNRKGMMLGEGASILILESLEHAEKRGAKIYAEILGYGLSCDAHHMTQPAEEGIVSCMKKALKESNILAEEVGYISTHGTGTLQNDKVECEALRSVFGRRLKHISCSSIKSMLGHTMGAASAMEAVVCCLVIEDGILPPTINYETPDEDCDIDCVPNKSEEKKINIALNNSYAFGGNNCCVIFKRYTFS